MIEGKKETKNKKEKNMSSTPLYTFYYTSDPNLIRSTSLCSYCQDKPPCMKETTRYSSLYSDVDQTVEIGYRQMNSSHILLDDKTKLYSSMSSAIFSFDDVSGTSRQLFLNWSDQVTLDQCLIYPDYEEKDLLGTEIEGPELGYQFRIHYTFYQDRKRKVQVYEL